MDRNLIEPVISVATLATLFGSIIGIVYKRELELKNQYCKERYGKSYKQYKRECEVVSFLIDKHLKFKSGNTKDPAEVIKRLEKLGVEFCPNETNYL